MKRFCEYCGEEFTASRSDQKYCSDACKSAAYRERKTSTPELNFSTVFFLGVASLGSEVYQKYHDLYHKPKTDGLGGPGWYQVQNSTVIRRLMKGKDFGSSERAKEFFVKGHNFIHFTDIRDLADKYKGFLYALDLTRRKDI